MGGNIPGKGSELLETMALGELEEITRRFRLKADGRTPHDIRRTFAPMFNNIMYMIGIGRRPESEEHPEQAKLVKAISNVFDKGLK